MVGLPAEKLIWELGSLQRVQDPGGRAWTSPLWCSGYGGGQPGTLKEEVESDQGGGEGQSRGGEKQAHFSCKEEFEVVDKVGKSRTQSHSSPPVVNP